MKKQFHTLFVSIICIIIPGIVGLAVILSVLNIDASKNVYVENFVEAQEKLFSQIDQDIYNFFSDVGAITSGVNNSTAVSEYLTKEEWDVVAEMKDGNVRGQIVTVEGQSRGYMMQRMQSTNYTMLGVVDPAAAFDNAYDFRYIVGVTGVITALIAIAIFILVRQLTHPLSRLANHMIWQGEKEKSVRLIDAFIKLLRNTISNKQDMITLRQEIENLQDYGIEIKSEEGFGTIVTLRFPNKETPHSAGQES